MKKILILLFALVLSIGNTYAYRIWVLLEKENDWQHHCYGEDGSCLPTVIVEQ